MASFYSVFNLGRLRGKDKFRGKLSRLRGKWKGGWLRGEEDEGLNMLGTVDLEWSLSPLSKKVEG